MGIRPFHSPAHYWLGSLALLCVATIPLRAAERPHIVLMIAEDHWHDFEDHAWSVRSERYKFILNNYPDLPNTPPADALRSPTFQQMRRLRSEDRLTPVQQACFVRPRAKEELYDVTTDPYELHINSNTPKPSWQPLRINFGTLGVAGIDASPGT